ncbi:DUF6193 family natural product biosynthesis protein [Streptomyces hydrogenans]|uniref:DUF6193 family natural product biosynthesis protein n=1 Tax=Streptomyces hydrogenans TaxID=1873719 RepID=UPI0033C777A7
MKRQWSRRPGAEYWRGTLGHGGGDPDVIAAAYAEPRLRALFPFPSHGALSFHQNTQYPWSNDLPYIVGDAEWCVVYAPRDVDGVLGESLTSWCVIAADASLLVAGMIQV